MSELKKRNTQTVVKHTVLRDYLITWGSIITRGLCTQYKRIVSQGKTFTTKFAYVDAFSYQGKYSSGDETDSPVWGSPIIGIKALDEIQQGMVNQCQFTPEVYTILIEKKRDVYEALLENLREAGFGARIRQTDNFSALQSNEIAVIHGDFEEYAQELLEFTSQPYLWTLYFLDPYGTGGLPLSIVQSITSQNHNDVIINFPYLDIQRKRHPESFDRFFGGSDWRQVAEIVDTDEREAASVELYISLLQQNDPSLGIKKIPLLFPDKERSIFYLILTTHDPTGGLAMNKLLDDAKLTEYDLREEEKIKKLLREAGAVQLKLFDVDPARPQPSRPKSEEVAKNIYETCKGRTLKYRDVLQFLINTRLYPEDVKRAMTYLKRNKKVQYKFLRNNEDMTFSNDQF